MAYIQKSRLRNAIREIDSNKYVSADALDVLSEYIDEQVDAMVTNAFSITETRKAKTLTSDDVKTACKIMGY